MTNPQTPDEWRAEQERVLARVNAYDAALAEVRRLSDERTARYEKLAKAAEESGKEWPPLPDPTPEHVAAWEAWADAKKNLPDPALATAYAALLRRHAALLEQDRWIPVEERLPENEDEMVMVATQTQRMGGIEKAIRTGFFGEDGRGGYFAVLAGVNGGLRIFGLYHLHDWGEVATHWRPLPTPPAPASAAAVRAE